MKTVVVYKWARDPEDAAVRSDGTIDWRGAKMTPGEDDHAAVAAAREITAATGGRLVGLTIGDGDATWALARGIEEAVAVPDAPAVADNGATAAILAAAIRRIGDVDLIVMGDAEGYPGVAAALAGVLGWPALVGLASISAADGTGGAVRATRRAGDDLVTFRIARPAVLGIAAAAAEKQAPGMKEVLMARKRPVTAVPLAALEAGPLDRLASRGTRVPEASAARIFDGDPAAAAAQLVAALRADGVL